jgi:hypothetical protein
MSCLKLFIRLKKLFVPIAPIYSSSDIVLQTQSLASILPPSIESLTLMEHVTPTARGVLHKDLLRLIEKKPALFPQLTKIISDSVQVCDEGLTNVFWQAGVALIHRELPRSKWDYTGQLFYDCEYRPWDAAWEGYYMKMPLPCELSDDDL